MLPWAGHVRVVQLLISKGALLHRDHQGRTPLHLAAAGGHTCTITAILSVHTHTLDQTDKDGVRQSCIYCFPFCDPLTHETTLQNKPKLFNYAYSFLLAPVMVDIL